MDRDQDDFIPDVEDWRDEDRDREEVEGEEELSPEDEYMHNAEWAELNFDPEMLELKRRDLEPQKD